MICGGVTMTTKLKLKMRHICIYLVVSARRTRIHLTSKVSAASLRSLWQLSLERASPLTWLLA